MMITNNNYRYLLFAVLFAAACQKQDHAYRDFLKDGEIVYVGKADSVRTYPGHSRLKLSWLLLSDPTVKRAKIYWNNRTDSVDIPLRKTDAVDTVEVHVDGLAEGGYTFEIFTFDDKGNRSVATSVFGYVYGDTYQSSLLPRNVRTIEIEDGAGLNIQWGGGSEQMADTEIKYEDQGGAIRYALVPASAQTVQLEDWKLGSTVEFRTYYVPDPMAIDTFVTGYEQLTVDLAYLENVQLNSGLFNEYRLPGDAPHSALNGVKMSNLWSGVLAGGAPAGAWYRTETGSGMPHHFQFDIGITAKLTKYVIWQRGNQTEFNLLYANGNLRRWEIWGSTNPSPDGSYDGWTKLMDCEIIKPSGTPISTRTDEDIAAAQAGHEFVFPDDIPEVRYIRVRALQNWAGTDFMFASEIRLWGNYWSVK